MEDAGTSGTGTGGGSASTGVGGAPGRGGAPAGSDAGPPTGSGGIAIAGSGGGPVGGSSGEGGTRASGGGGGGPPDASIGGAGGRATVPDAGPGGGLGPLRLVIFYTRWGTSYPEWWPSGSDRTFTMSTMLQPLAPFQKNLILLSGLTNANVYMDTGTSFRGADANDMGDAMLTLLTARPAVRGTTAEGPSLDTVIGDCGGAAGPPLRLQVGQFGFDDNPGVSFDASGAAIRGEKDPNAVAMRLLGRSISAPAPDADVDSAYPGIGAAQMNVAVEALAKGKACVVTLMWGDQVIPQWIGDTDIIHNLSHLTSDYYTAVTSPMPPSTPTGQFQKLQTWYAQEFASLLGQMQQVAVGAGTLLDQSVVVWISESGQGSDHRGYFVPVVIAGGGGRLDTGRFIEMEPHPVPPSDTLTIRRTQGDLLAALAGLWGIATFGDPQITRQPLTEILKP